jgi:undecaprenyl-diphosphatase
MLAPDISATFSDPGAFDRQVRSWMLAHQSVGMREVQGWVSTFGSVTPMAILAIIGALVMIGRGRRAAVIPLLLAPIGGVLTYYFVKRVFARSRPAGTGNFLEGTYSFPSAHATTSAAVCVTLAYIFWREGIMSGVVALVLAILVPVVIGTSRVYLDMHWATDVIGGWCAGLVIAGLAAALYNRGTTAAAPARATRAP